MQRYLFITAWAAIFSVLIGAPWRAIAESSGDGGRRNTPPIRMAIVVLVGNSQYNDVARDVTDGITANLVRSGQFALIGSAGIKNQIVDFDTPPPFDEYRSIDTQALVVVDFAKGFGDKITASYRLWDVLERAHLSSRRYETSSTMIDRLGNCISAEIQQRLTDTISDVACR